MQPTGVIRFIESIVRVLAAVAAADVICRYFFNAPIPGSLELVEFMMAIIVPFGIAYCALRRSHVTVDMIVDRFPSPVRRAIEIFTTTIAVLFLGILCWQNILNIFDSYQSHMTSAVLKLPAYPFVVPVTVGMGLFALILVIHLLFKNSKEASDGAS